MLILLEQKIGKMTSSIIRVTKEFSFDMAHALLGYDGPCSNIHGHTYHLHVTIRGRVLNQTNHPKDGMLLDFGLLKAIVNQKVIQKYDHSLVLNKELTEEVKINLSHITEKIIYTSFQPTCENLLLSIKEELYTAFAHENFDLCALKLYETPTSYAEWLITDN